MNRYPLWKYIVIALVVVVGLIYAFPNIYGEDPSIQISPNSTKAVMNQAAVNDVKSILAAHQLTYKRMDLSERELLVRFNDTTLQLKAQEALKQALKDKYTVALNIAPATPSWFSIFGAMPMKLGLDLRGGIHFLLDVDVISVVHLREQADIRTMGEQMRGENIRYTGIKEIKGKGIEISFANSDAMEDAYALIKRDFPNYTIQRQTRGGLAFLNISMSPMVMNDLRQETIDQTLTTLRNRVNELGVSEPLVQQQGANRVAVDLPGIQDSARAKQILGGTATLQFYLVDTTHDAQLAANSGVAPIGTKLFQYQGRPVLLQNRVLLSGNSITSANASFGEDGRPSVNIAVGGGGVSLFNRATRENIGRPMAILYIETKTDNKIVNGKLEKIRRREERVISVATIQSALGTNFQITGLSDPLEARNLALLLRAGALVANIDIVQERTIGPSLGKENIQRGILSLEIGMGLIVIFMALYYRWLGVIADLALVLNLVLLVAILSLIGATLTLPGIAGIVLTVGMAVDANVLIFERIREELRNGMTPHAAIHAGYERAFSTIVDANVTTLIVALVLFGIGSGPIKGFAVTLTIGLLVSMFTAITFTRAIVNLIYGHKQIKKVSVGI